MRIKTTERKSQVIRDDMSDSEFELALAEMLRIEAEEKI